MSTRNQEKKVEKQGVFNQKTLSISDNAMFAQMMKMIKNITIKLKALKTRSSNSTPVYFILSSASTTFAPQSIQSII